MATGFFSPLRKRTKSKDQTQSEATGPKYLSSNVESTITAGEGSVREIVTMGKSDFPYAGG